MHIFHTLEKYVAAILRNLHARSQNTEKGVKDHLSVQTPRKGCRAQKTETAIILIIMHNKTLHFSGLVIATRLQMVMVRPEGTDGGEQMWSLHANHPFFPHYLQGLKD